MNAKWEDFLIKGSREGYCAVCGEKTDMIDITFEVYVCSVQCSQSLWEEYVNTLQKRKNTLHGYLAKKEG